MFTILKTCQIDFIPQIMSGQEIGVLIWGFGRWPSYIIPPKYAVIIREGNLKQYNFHP